MKKYISGLITGIILALSFSTFAAVQLKVIPNPYPVLINGIKASVDGYNINGSTYLKLSDLNTIGFEVEFIEKQIKIKSKEVAAPDSTTKSSKNNLSAAIKIVDGLEIYTIDNIEHVAIVSIAKKYYDDGFSFTYDKALNKTSLKNKKDDIILLDSIPTTIIKNLGYVKYDYFKNTLLPLLT